MPHYSQTQEKGGQYTKMSGQSRKILLLEPAYKNKFPPLGLMKISAYHKALGDTVIFRKIVPEDLAATMLLEELYPEGTEDSRHKLGYIKHGKRSRYKNVTPELEKLHNRYLCRDFPKFDRVYVSTLFTFYWALTVKTINAAKELCKDWRTDLFTGGAAATLMSEKLQQDTGVVLLSGLLDKGGELDPDSSIIIDTLTPDYSILDDIEYKYPAAEDTHFTYSTRGCIRRCPFCAVPKLEPVYKGYIDIKPGFREASALREAQGKRKFRRLVLMDNNVLASKDFGKIIDDIKELGFDRYSGHGVRKTVDFNQGLDARLLTEEKCAKLAEIEIDPLRIAFDDWNEREIYEKAVRTAVKCGIKRLSNYLLYNFNDKPEELFLRLQMNVRLCEELGADIYSFPMKYQPINDPEYFNNRDYTGPHWNKKFIRAVQNLLVCTSGMVGKGLSYFECAFGRTSDEFMERLWTPEAFLRNREYYAEETSRWRAAIARLTSEERYRAERIISLSLPSAIKGAAKQEESQRVRDSLNFYVAYGDGKKRVIKEVKECPA